nr:DUF397 domain-containing protein [Streptosporangium sp. NBC_01495]
MAQSLPQLGRGTELRRGRGTPGGEQAVRDSKNPSGPVLRFTPGQWNSFIRGVKDGEFD